MKQCPYCKAPFVTPVQRGAEPDPILNEACSNCQAIVIGYRNTGFALARNDINELIAAQQSYGDSWKKRGGVGAFMMLARKWDRIFNQTSKLSPGNIVAAGAQCVGRDDMRDDVGDLRRYLLLVVGELAARDAEAGLETHDEVWSYLRRVSARCVLSLNPFPQNNEVLTLVVSELWDVVEEDARNEGWDVFAAVERLPDDNLGTLLKLIHRLYQIEILINHQAEYNRARARAQTPPPTSAPVALYEQGAE